MMENREAFEFKKRYSMSLTTSRGFTNGLSNEVAWKSESSKTKKRKMILTAAAIAVSLTMIVIGIMLIL
ncbi:MAG: hypothetical protein QXT63_06150 [Thermoplasmata archaeon]